MKNLEEITGYKEALEQERDARDFAFIESAAMRRICGFKVRPMTLVDLTTRIKIRCPFLCARSASPGETASFIWHLSPDRHASPSALDRVLRRPTAYDKFINRLSTIGYADLEREIDDFLDWTFLDAPSARSGTKYSPKTSFAATFVHAIASNYHWSESEILNLPLVRLYQYLREIIVSKNPANILFNRRSDKIRGDYLRSLQEADQALKT